MMMTGEPPSGGYTCDERVTGPAGASVSSNGADSTGKNLRDIPPI